MNRFACSDNYRCFAQYLVLYLGFDFQKSFKLFYGHRSQTLFIKAKHFNLCVDNLSLFSNHNLFLVKFPSLCILFKEFNIFLWGLVFFHHIPTSFDPLLSDDFRQVNVPLKVIQSDQALDVGICIQMILAEIKVQIMQDILLSLAHWRNFFC